MALKRKIEKESKNSGHDPKASKVQVKVLGKDSEVKKVDINLKIKKVQTKADLLLQVKDLQQAYGALEEINKKGTQLIENLELQVETLEKEMQSMKNIPKEKEMIFKQTQTETDVTFKCEECNFEGETERELGWHMGKNHRWPSEKKSEDMDISDISEDRPRNCEKCNYAAEDMYDLDAHTWTEHEELSYFESGSKPFSCNLCEEVLQTKGDLMKHKKDEHNDKVNTCWKFDAGYCSFGDDKCWFIHDEEKKSVEYPCNQCEKVFVTQTDIMEHRKKHHKQLVQLCKNENNGTCIFGFKKCWFRHDNEQTNNKNKKHEKDIEENKEVTQRMFEMMETITQRVIQIEMKTTHIK